MASVSALKTEVDLEDEAGRPESSPATDLPIGSQHHRALVGAAEGYDIVGAVQFNLLTFLGLREQHFLLDIGCGSLRGGRLFIPYLLPGRYFGVEPEQWLIEEGVKHEVGRDLIEVKQPVFSSDRDFTLSIFNQRFDFILAQSIFSHASLSQIRRCLSEAKKVMGPTTLFAATFVRGEHDYTGDAWVYPGCITYTPGRMVGLAEEQGLICRLIDWPHPAQQTWLIIAHPESEEQIPDPSDLTKLLCLESELRFAKARLAKLERHPYVRLGLNIVGHPLYSRLRSTANRLLKAA